MPDGFFGTRPGFTPDLWAPLSMTEQMSGGALDPTEQTNYIELSLRLETGASKPGVETTLTDAWRRW